VQLARRGLVGFAVVALWGCAESVGPPPNTKPAPRSVNLVNGWVISPPDKNFIEERRLSLQGEKTIRGGCRMGYEQRVQRRQKGADRIAEYNPATCAFVLSQGHFKHARKAAHHPRARRVEPPAKFMHAPGPSLADVSSLAEMFSSRGTVWQHIWHEDPAHKYVTEHENWFDWDWDGYCASNPLGTAYVYWYADSGWHEPTFEREYFDANCDWQQERAQSHFYNDQFCFQIYAYVDYDLSSRGYYDGSAWLSWYGTASGGCSDALTVYHEWQTY
jgi:hypothetical protein